MKWRNYIVLILYMINIIIFHIIYFQLNDLFVTWWNKLFTACQDLYLFLNVYTYYFLFYNWHGYLQTHVEMDIWVFDDDRRKLDMLCDHTSIKQVFVKYYTPLSSSLSAKGIFLFITHNRCSQILFISGPIKS